MLFMSCVCHAFVSVHCCLVVTCWERADLFTLVCDCVFVTFSSGILGQVWYLIVTMQNRWNNRISDGCVYAQIRKGLGMHLVTYSNHDTVPFLLIGPIKGRFV